MYQKHQSRLAQVSHSCCIVFSIPYQSPGAYSSFHVLSVLFCDQPGQQSPQFCKYFFVFVDYYKFCFSDSLYVKAHWTLCVSFSRTDAGLCIYHLFVWSNFLHISQWISLSTQSRLVLYFFCANLLHSLMWMMASSLSQHSLYICYFAASNLFLALIWLVLMVLFCAIIIIIIIIFYILGQYCNSLYSFFSRNSFIYQYQSVLMWGFPMLQSVHRIPKRFVQW